MQWFNNSEKMQKDKDTKAKGHKDTKVQRCSTALYNSLVLHNKAVLLNGMALLNDAALLYGVAWC